MGFFFGENLDLRLSILIKMTVADDVLITFWKKVEIEINWYNSR